SIFQIASIARWVSVAAIATDHTIFRALAASSGWRRPFEQLPNLTFPVARYLKELLHVADCFLFRFRTQNRQPAHDFLGFGERAVRHRHLSSILTNASAHRAWQTALYRQQRASPHPFSDQLAHSVHLLL